MGDDDKPTEVPANSGGGPKVGRLSEAGALTNGGAGANVSGSIVGSLAVGDQARAITLIHQHGLSFTEA